MESENSIFVRMHGIDKNYSVKLSKHMLLELMGKDEFTYYYNTHNLVKERLRSYYCISPQGSIISPRWVLEYLRDRCFDLFEENQKTNIIYNHSHSAVKIFETLNIPVLRFNKASK
ncbi:hypothetical protein SAMN03159341_1427 [Paenibacillus sp. 1_12]|uniref:hypothetical protein n=1 Tax=Paenibacillus sp. 1_12 TaxID=1566278 RepID=UPI0008E65582|nr:hypothetical protein [Paenibacillus sp. 1_12]SFM52199.1 hypothetical protein SAMN03159341_1427 [Paenibacillus sp. 1_12]